MECVGLRIFKKKSVSKIVTKSKSDFHIFLSPPHFREKNLIRRLQFCVVQKHTHTVIILDFWAYLLTKKKTSPLQKKKKKMEDLKEMFALMMKFQMESQQKNEEKLLQLQKENEKRILKNEEKQQQFP